jgi:hypothetical protein
MSGSLPRSQRFDLSSVEADRYQRMKRTQLLVHSVLGVLLIVGGVGLTTAVLKILGTFPGLLGQPDGRWVLALFGAVLAYVGIVAVLFVASVRHGGRGPIWAKVDPRGCSLIWRDGCTKSWTWDDLRGLLRLQETQVSTRVMRTSIQLSIASFVALSVEARDAIVASAQARGLTVRTSEFAGTPYTAPHTEILIHRVNLRDG